jgi:hypothetical protein
MRKIYLCILFLGFLSSAKGQQWQWARNPVADNINGAADVAADTLGNSYITGTFIADSIIFDNVTLYKQGIFDIFITKYDSAGNVVWAKRAGGNKHDEGLGIAVDKQGNVYVTGRIGSDTAWFDTIAVSSYNTTSSSDFFIAKYNSSGNALWVKAAGTPGNDEEGSAVAVDDNGHAYVTGHFNSTITLGSYTLSNNGGIHADVLIAKFDSLGNVVWAKNAGNTLSDVGNDISVDALNNVLVTGTYVDSVYFDNILLPRQTGPHIFTVKYNTNGNVIWAKAAIGIMGAHPECITTDASGNSYITGSFYGDTISFDNISLINNGGYDIFIVKYDINGNVVWAKNGNGKYSEDGNAIVTDADGNCYVSGNFSSDTLSFGNYQMINASPDRDAFVVKINPLGVYEWALQVEGNGVYPKGIAYDESGNIYLAGSFFGTPQSFGNSTLYNSQGEDVFNAKLKVKDLATNIGVLSSTNSFQLFPNPTTGLFTLHCPLSTVNSQLNIYNSLGELVYNKKLLAGRNEIDFGGKPGVYFLQAEDFVQKLIIY